MSALEPNLQYTVTKASMQRQTETCKLKFMFISGPQMFASALQKYMTNTLFTKPVAIVTN